MFDLWGIRKRHRKDELRYAILHGQVRALLLVVASMIALIPKRERDVLIESLKTQVGQGFTSDAVWFNEEAKQMFNDSLSATLQTFIETTAESPVKSQA